MLIVLRCIAAFTLACAGLPAIAGWVDGSSLVAAMEGRDRDDSGYRSGYFDGYVKGVADATVDRLWCPDPQVKGGQLPEIVANHLRANPSTWHLPGDVLVVNALRAAYPCGEE